MDMGVGNGWYIIPLCRRGMEGVFLDGEEVETGLGLHIIEQEKSRRLQSPVNRLRPPAKATRLG